VLCLIRKYVLSSLARFGRVSRSLRDTQVSDAGRGLAVNFDLGVSGLTKPLAKSCSYSCTLPRLVGKSLHISCLHQRPDKTGEMDECANIYQLCCCATDWSRLIVWNRPMDAVTLIENPSCIWKTVGSIQEAIDSLYCMVVLVHIRGTCDHSAPSGFNADL
jgi:hypothetical protein